MLFLLIVNTSGKVSNVLKVERARGDGATRGTPRDSPLLIGALAR